MAVMLTINGQTTPATPGPSLFDYAEQLGVKVPTSCQKQGKCKECLVEIVQGMDRLSPPTPHEEHLKGNFRLSCRAHVVADAGEIRCQIMRRGRRRIESGGLALPLDGRKMELEPAVTRDGDRILIDGEEIDRCAGPIHGIAMDL